MRGICAVIGTVYAAFTLEWSNGPTEGQVNRVKFLKRQTYGRAVFGLLRRRRWLCDENGTFIWQTGTEAFHQTCH